MAEPKTQTPNTPETPTQLPKRSWMGTIKRVVRGFQQDNLTDWAAALTYYGVLSLFPAVIVLVSGLALLGPSGTQALTDTIRQTAPANMQPIMLDVLNGLQQSRGAAGVLAIVGVAAALWSASGYIGAFMRASNVIYDMPEGRPIWKTIPLRIAITVGVVILLAAAAVGLAASGGIADRIGSMLGLGDTLVLVWNIAKWPLILVLVGVTFAVLYWASPNVRQPKFRWLSPGGLVAVLLWIIASAGFAIYVANFSSYNATYGSLGGVIAFLVWLWISNIAILLGAELDAELAREKRRIEGHRGELEPFLPPRDTRAMDEQEQAEVQAAGQAPPART